MNNYRKKPFLIGILLTLVVILAEAGTVFANDKSVDLRSLNLLCNVLGFSLTPMIPIVITFIFDSVLLKNHKLIMVPTLVNLVAAVLSPFLGLIFYVDANNHYVRGEYFFIFIIVYVTNLLLLVLRTIELGKTYNYPIMRKLVALSLFTIVGTSIQLVNPSAYSSWHCVTFALLLYLLLMSEFDSSFDTMTGLYNRAVFEKVTKQMSRSKEFCVILIDINDFKKVNDTYGHDFGDTVIKEVATIVRKTFNKNFTCYRFGGDEIAIIGKETEQERIEAQLRMMIKNLAEARQQGKTLPTVSYGYSIYRGGEKLDFHQALKEADTQMYQYKKLYKADSTQHF